MLDAAGRALALAAAQGKSLYLADCNRALRALQPILCQCPASQAIKLCSATLDSLIRACASQPDTSSIALVREIICLAETALKMLGNAQGLQGSRSWQSFTTALLPAAIAVMWHLQSSPDLHESIWQLSNALKLSVQNFLAHPEHLLAAANEFQLLAMNHPTVGIAETAVAGDTQQKTQQKQKKQYHANGVLQVWQLVEQLGSGVSMSLQHIRALHNVHRFSGWLIHTYHSCIGPPHVRSGTFRPVDLKKDPHGTANSSSEAVRTLPWHALCVILQRGMDVLRRTGESPQSQQSTCVALAACTEALRAALECKVRDVWMHKYHVMVSVTDTVWSSAQTGTAIRCWF